MATKRNPAPSRAKAARVDSASARHDDPRIPAVLEHIRGGTPIKNAFALERIPKSTAYLWMEASEQLRNDVDQARAVASEVRRKDFEADPSAPRLHYMQTLDPENFPTPKTRVGLEGGEEGSRPITVRSVDAVDKLSEKELRQAAMALLKEQG